jgi:hypothetical protein
MDHLIKLLSFLFGFLEQIKKDLEDHKISRIEAWGLITNAVTGLWNPIANFSEVKEALKLVATDDTARQQLIDALKEEFDLPDEELEKRIEAGLTLLNNIYGYIRSWFPSENVG